MFNGSVKRYDKSNQLFQPVINIQADALTTYSIMKQDNILSFFLSFDESKTKELLELLKFWESRPHLANKSEELHSIHHAWY